MVLAIELITGAVTGIVFKFVGNLIEKFLLERRNLEYDHSKIEDFIFMALMAIAGAATMYKATEQPATAIYSFLILIICQVIAVIDLHHRIIPNGLLLAMLVIRTGFGIPDLLGVKGFPETSILLSLLGFVVGFIIFILPSLMGNNVGAGDIKLAACIGYCLGVMNLLYTIILMGFAILAYSVLQKSSPILYVMKSMIPMGPFIALATIIVMNITKFI